MHMNKKKAEKIDTSLIPVEGDVKNLLDMFEFFLMERHLEKPIESLGEAVRDLRLIIGRILVDHFLKVEAEEEAKFCAALATMLADRCAELPVEGGLEQSYQDYCISEILVSFEYAQEIKEAYPDDTVLQKILALDIPILRPFDYGLQGKLKVIEKQKKRKFHG
ncbi:MAG: hypothetical protein HN337_05390 [Deltaproteobacteria bacterium]|jgi:hypothetical protein|nr:hypothetical protein [Deltaproteobacteria bacterium]